ncbi:MAG: hypothetical protein ABIO60_13510 [Aquaticitalea sp.]
MKNLLTLLWVSCVFCSTTLAQTMEGTYSNTWENSAGASLTYTLTLKPNGTFLFESYRIYETADPSKFVAVKGTWAQNDRLLTLNTETSAGDDELVKNLNSTQARLEEYSPRHIQYGKIKPSLKFYESEVFYAKGMKLEKESNDSFTSTDVRTAFLNEDDN